jgi:hypothetical protein
MRDFTGRAMPTTTNVSAVTIPIGIQASPNGAARNVNQESHVSPRRSVDERFRLPLSDELFAY